MAVVHGQVLDPGAEQLADPHAGLGQQPDDDRGAGVGQAVDVTEQLPGLLRGQGDAGRLPRAGRPPHVRRPSAPGDGEAVLARRADDLGLESKGQLMPTLAVGQAPVACSYAHAVIVTWPADISAAPRRYPITGIRGIHIAE